MQKLPVNGIYILLSKRRRLFGSVDYWLSAEICFVTIVLEFGTVDSNYFIFLIFLFLFFSLFWGLRIRVNVTSQSQSHERAYTVCFTHVDLKANIWLFRIG